MNPAGGRSIILINNIFNVVCLSLKKSHFCKIYLLKFKIKGIKVELYGPERKDPETR